MSDPIQDAAKKVTDTVTGAANSADHAVTRAENTVSHNAKYVLLAAGALVFIALAVLALKVF